MACTPKPPAEWAVIRGKAVEEWVRGNSARRSWEHVERRSHVGYGARTTSGRQLEAAEVLEAMNPGLCFRKRTGKRCGNRWRRITRDTISRAEPLRQLTLNVMSKWSSGRSYTPTKRSSEGNYGVKLWSLCERIWEIQKGRGKRSLFSESLGSYKSICRDKEFLQFWWTCPLTQTTKRDSTGFWRCPSGEKNRARSWPHAAYHLIRSNSRSIFWVWR